MSKYEEVSWIDHLDELRKRILWVAIVFVITAVGGLFGAGQIIQYLKNTPPASEISWNVFSPWDAISIYMQFAFIISLTVTLPFTLYQLWRFVSPGLQEEERKAAVKYIPGAFFLFLLGLAFAYFIVFPMAFSFTSSVTRTLGLTETYGITQYFTFLFNIVLPMSVLFELPIVVMFLTRIRVLNPKRLQKLRRYAYLILVIVATFVTPPDFISDFLVAIPLIILYEISVMLSMAVHRKQLAADLAREI